MSGTNKTVMSDAIIKKTSVAEALVNANEKALQINKPVSKKKKN